MGLVNTDFTFKKWHFNLHHRRKYLISVGSHLTNWQNNSSWACWSGTLPWIAQNIYLILWVYQHMLLNAYTHSVYALWFVSILIQESKLWTLEISNDGNWQIHFSLTLVCFPLPGERAPWRPQPCKLPSASSLSANLWKGSEAIHNQT